jgi:hypothetical protein
MIGHIPGYSIRAIPYLLLYYISGGLWRNALTLLFFT